MARKAFVSNLTQFAAFGLPVFFHFPPSLSLPSDLGLMRGRKVARIPHLGEGGREGGKSGEECEGGMQIIPAPPPPP